MAVLLSGTPEGDDYAKVSVEAIEGAVKELASKANFSVRLVPNVPYTAQATQITLQLFRGGTNVVIDTGGYGSLFAEACKQEPSKICIDYGTQLDKSSLESAPNLSTVYVDQAPSFYAEGVAAGMMTKTGKLGFVSAFKVPFNSAVVNAFALGCQSVKPDCTVNNVYINSYYDPPKTVEAANTLLDAGADVIAHFVDDVTPLKTAEQHGAVGFGLYRDQSSQVPKAWVTGLDFLPALKSAYKAELEAIAEGNWKAGIINYGPEPVSNLPLEPFGSIVPAAVKTATEKVMEEFKEGNNPFQGPIEDTSGKVRVPKGKSIGMRSTYMYAKWGWGVKGVTGL
ncbi:MAG: BMP family ABC transporter substrate-binding protein [Actinobacteria bacterium]|nr:BMP family ABC transporter substrate-binding protein [Actinomycetota bacterium]